MGGFAEELLLSGQRVIPDAAMRSGFVFEYATIDAALVQIVGKPKREPSNGVAITCSAVAKA
jgi:hypothetical protein